MSKRGQQPIKKPAGWSREYYINLKNSGLSDVAIADKFYINVSTLINWKRQLGFKKDDFKHIKISKLKQYQKSG